MNLFAYAAKKDIQYDFLTFISIDTFKKWK